MLNGHICNVVSIIMVAGIFRISYNFIKTLILKIIHEFIYKSNTVVNELS